MTDKELITKEFLEALQDREDQKRKYVETPPNWEQYQYYLLLAAEEKVMALLREAKDLGNALPPRSSKGAVVITGEDTKE